MGIWGEKKKKEKLKRCLEEWEVIFKMIDGEGILRVRSENQAKTGKIKIWDENKKKKKKKEKQEKNSGMKMKKKKNKKKTC